MPNVVGSASDSADIEETDIARKLYRRLVNELAECWCGKYEISPKLVLTLSVIVTCAVVLWIT